MFDSFYLDERQNAVIPNELLYDAGNKYIWYDGDLEQQTEAQSLFGYLLQRKIYVKGFAVGYEPEKGTRMFNKPFVNILSLNPNEDMLIVDRYYPKTIYKNQVEAKQINPSISKNDEIIIWGAGRNGKALLKLLSKCQMLENVICIIDSDIKMWGEHIEEIPICGIEKLDEVREDIVLIEAFDAWEEMDRELGNVYRKYHYTIDRDRRIFPNGDLALKPLFSINEGFYELLETKTVWVFGTDQRAAAMLDYFELLDGNCGGLLAGEEKIECGNTIYGRDVKYIDELLYEDNCMIWYDYQDRIKVSSKVRELGLYDLGICEVFPPLCAEGADYVMDINLGLTYIKNGRCGISVYGAEKTDSYKIVTLGGSTTDGEVNSIPSWPEILHDVINREDVTIYNAGCAGYTSAWELIKLIRDMLGIGPDMVISYSGVNDSILPDSNFPFNGCGLWNMFRTMQKLCVNPAGWELREDGAIMCGVPSKKDRFDNWLTNMRHMNAIVQMTGGCFYGFLQPMLASKNGRTRQENNKLLNVRLKEFDVNGMNGREDSVFRRYMMDRKVEQTYDYLYDLSHIFDDIDGVYIDLCHVYEKGNRIIASEIYSRISGKIDTWKLR